MIERTMNSRWRWTETKNQWINKPNGIEWMSQWTNKQENERTKVKSDSKDISEF